MWSRLISFGLNFWFLCGIFLFSMLPSCAQHPDQDSVKKAFSYQVNDSLLVDVNVSFKDRNPIAYFSHLETDVCSDDLCKPIHLTVCWDLLGNFLSYRTDDFHPLTKFDHMEMTKEDHDQLHAILSDTASLLRDYYVEDMIDIRQEVYSTKVDAVTKPTINTFENVTVEGALYTVYTLWHFVNGGIRKEMFEHTTSLVATPLINYMLQSDNRDYVKYILEQDNASVPWDRFIPQIITLISHSDAYIPHFAITKLQDSVLMDEKYQVKIIDQLSNVNDQVRNMLLIRLETIRLESTSITKLIASIYTMTEQQADKATRILYNNRNRMTEGQRTDLSAILTKTEKKEVAEVVEKLLRRIK